MPQSNLFESMESRRMMSVVPVTNTSDNGPGSFREATLISRPGDTIDLRAVSGTIILTHAPATLAPHITLIGPGEHVLTLQGNGSDPVLINTSDLLTISDLTINGGNSLSSSGGGIFNRGSLMLDHVTVSNNRAFLFGGGVFSNAGDVTLTDCTFINNTAQGALEASGGALYMSTGHLTINNSTFTQNQAIGASNTGVVASGPGTGGGLYLTNTLDSTITNSTFGDNSAIGGTGSLVTTSGTAYGGAIYTNTSHGTLLNHVTIAYNDAKGGGTALTQATSQGGGIYSTGTGVVTLKDTIAALNSAQSQPDVLNTLLNSLGNNLIGVYTGNAMVNGLLGNRLGTALAPYAPGVATTLASNGGDTMTYALMPDSTAVNGGSVDSPALDQRGLGRRDAPDMGAFELDANHLPEIAVNAGLAVAGQAYSQTLAGVDADGDTLVYSSPNLPDWLHFETANGITSLVGTPSELDASAATTIRINAFDGFQTVSTSFKLKVGIAGIDLSPSGLLRVNGTEFNDELSITLLDDDTVRVLRNGFKRNFALADIKKIQIFGFGGDDNILVNVGKARATIFAGDGKDTVQSGAGADYIVGGTGDDILYAGAGNDRIDADGGADRLFGEAGNDTLHGGAGRDRIDGGLGRNRLFGDSGNDTFFSLKGIRDTIDGGLGDDDGQWNKTATVSDAVLS